MPDRPYQFCRYEIVIGEDILSAAGQRAFFTDNQGQTVPYRSWGAQQDDSSIQIMEPQPFKIQGHEAISVLLGLQPGRRTVVGYDAARQRRTKTDARDTHIKIAHLVLVPSLNAMAIQDRNNDLCIPAGTAIRILRAIIRGFHGRDSEFSIVRLSNEEIRKAIETWELTDYSYTVRPLNPVVLSDLTNLRSEAMKAEHVARESAHLSAAEGDAMKPAGGPIEQTQEMVEAGYGQNGFAGITPDGHKAQVPKPPFHMDKAKNLREQEKPRLVRMAFEADSNDTDEHELSETIAQALVNFYALNE